MDSIGSMRWKHGGLFVLAFLVLAAFPYGPLFAWSPLRPGYAKQTFARADVLYPSELTKPPEYGNVDELVGLAERLHELRCSRRITIVHCRNWSDCVRFAGVFLVGQRPLAVTIPGGA